MSISMEPSMKVSGRMINRKEKVMKHGLMEPTIKDNTKTVRKMA